MVDCQYVSFQQPNTAPYSDLVVVDNHLLFLSGLVSEDMEGGELLPGSMTAETRQTLSNLKTILERHGSDMEHIIRVDVMLSDFSLRNEMNTEYVKHFSPGRLPARVCFGGVDLAEGCKIEIMVIAAKKCEE